MAVVMKHVSLLATTIQGQEGWCLVGPEGHPIQAFEAFNMMLLKRHPANTRKAYAHAVARFIDYLLAAEKSGMVFDRPTIRGLVEAFPDWLMLGGSSGNSIAQAMNKLIASPMLARSSADQAIAAVKRFLELSERLRQEQVESGIEPNSVDAIPLWEEMDKPRQLSQGEAGALHAKSMLAGVLSGGPKLIKDWALPIAKAPQNLFEQDVAFPFERAVDLIAQFKTHRDKALYAFLAASGCRMHEALQLLIEDVNPKLLSVKLIDPGSRPNHPSYLALTPVERDQLAWKGRTSSATLLLQPFKDLFFLHLIEYLKSEKGSSSHHEFIFRCEKGARAGSPFFLGQPAGRNEAFNRACAKLSLGKTYSPHALRHMYGTYLVNYFPNSSGGHGLPTEIVQKLMGHRSIANTQKYAKHDAQLLGADIAAAFTAAANPNGQTALEAKRAILVANLEQVERLIQEGGKRLS